jgi:long-chain fatty acid transport protein
VFRGGAEAGQADEWGKFARSANRRGSSREEAPAARVVRVALAVAGALVCSEARADDTHYQDFPVGGRAVGLGGAFTGLGDDPSGIYFNPAGIVDSTKSSVQISTTLYGLEVANSFFSTVHSVTDLKKVFTEINIIPSSASFVGTLGDTGPDGRPQRAYGLGVFVPSFRGLNVQNLSELPPGEQVGGCQQIAFQRTMLDRSFHFGASYAERIDPVLRFGLSTFFVYRSLSDHEETTCVGSPSSLSTAFGTAQTDLNMFVGSILVALGMKADLGAGWSLGLNWTAPSIRAMDSADVRVTRGAADPTSGRSAFVVRELKDLPAQTKLGTSLRLGAAYVEPYRLTFVADATAEAPISYQLFEIPVEQRDIRDAVTLVNQVERRFLVNFNAGFEYLISRPFSISSGLFTNFSSAPSIPGSIGSSFKESHLPHVNGFGGSFVLGFFGEHTLTRVGLTASYGSGSDVVPRYAGLSALGQQTEFVKVDLNQLFVFFYLSSTFRY